MLPDQRGFARSIVSHSLDTRLRDAIEGGELFEMP